MKIASIVSVLLLQFGGIAYSVEQNTHPLPSKIPFKKSLTLTSVLLFNSPQENKEEVVELSDQLKQFALLESEAKPALEPLFAARKKYKQTVRNTIFKSEQDLKNVMDQVEQETDENTAHNIEELDRDYLIQFDENAEPVAGSAAYTAILETAQLYHIQREEIKKHPLFAALKKVKTELKTSMRTYLCKHYTTVEQLQEKVNSPIERLNTYLDAMQRDR